ncbi:MAG: transposase [Elusimicrobia bacterium]|nr:transposase [Elusimicrobiota bacterium]
MLHRWKRDYKQDPQERLSRSRTTKGPGRRKPEAPAGVEKCRRRARDSKKNFNHLVAPKVERFRLIRRYEKEHRVDLMCRALDVSRSGYYWRRGAAVSSGSKENQVLLNQIKEIFENSRRTYGSPRVTEELQERGFPLRAPSRRATHEARGNPSEGKEADAGQGTQRKEVRGRAEPR